MKVELAGLAFARIAVRNWGMWKALQYQDSPFRTSMIAANVASLSRFATTVTVASTWHEIGRS